MVVMRDPSALSGFRMTSELVSPLHPVILSDSEGSRQGFVDMLDMRGPSALSGFRMTIRISE
jgi:hypothetical protein